MDKKKIKINARKLVLGTYVISSFIMNLVNIRKLKKTKIHNAILEFQNNIQNETLKIYKNTITILKEKEKLQNNKNKEENNKKNKKTKIFKKFYR